MIIAKEYRYDGEILIRPRLKKFERGHGERFSVLYDTEAFDIGVWEYDKIYQFKGLYDAIYCDILKEIAPFDITKLLFNLLSKENYDFNNNLNILDLGAGSGIVGEILRQNFPNAKIIGCDIFESAKIEAERLRPNNYDNYYVETISSSKDSRFLKNTNFDIHIILSASGGSDDDLYEDVMIDGYKTLVNHAKSGALFVF